MYRTRDSFWHDIAHKIMIGKEELYPLTTSSKLSGESSTTILFHDGPEIRHHVPHVRLAVLLQQLQLLQQSRIDVLVVKCLHRGGRFLVDLQKISS